MEGWKLKTYSSKEIKFQKKIVHLLDIIQQIEDYYELQNKTVKLFYKYVGKSKKTLEEFSQMFNFSYDAHIKDYREFTIKKVHDKAKQWRKENG